MENLSEYQWPKEFNMEYDFHDSALISSNYKNKELILCVQPYEIFYPDKNQVKITFSNIFNDEKASKLNRELNSGEEEKDWIGYRVEALHLDAKKNLKEEDIYVFVKIDYVEPITIHCKKLKIEEI